jgi:mannose-6-phosphate isomerase-like protein (cupin superfamily)
MAFATVTPAREFDVLAPDGSEIRFLATLDGASSVHCALPVGGVSLAVTHRTVEEIWYILSGAGEVWRKIGDTEETAVVAPGMCLTIPFGIHFQFRNIGNVPLEFFIVTLPPWPGENEAARVADYWPVT